MNSYAEAKQRIPSQRERIVNLLKEAGEEGVTNRQLVQIALRYSARLTELYRTGYEIEVTSLVGGLYKYVLRKEPGDIKTFRSATEEVVQEIELQYDGNITAMELSNLLDSKYFHIVRKNGYWHNGERVRA